MFTPFLLFLVGLNINKCKCDIPTRKGNDYPELQIALAGSVTEKISGSDEEWKNAVWKLGQREAAGVEK